MNKLLHIIATPRQDESRTLKVSGVFSETLKSVNPAWKMEELNLFTANLPELTVKRVDGKYILLGGGDLSGEFKKAWEDIVKYIEHFLSFDAYLISAPMWNFGIPYVLKHYIDIIIQPKYLFKYTPKGVEGMAKNKRMIVVTSRGGDYSQAETKNFDLEEPYLRTVFGFVGISDITFIYAQPMDAQGNDVREQKIKQSQEEARKLAENFR